MKAQSKRGKVWHGVLAERMVKLGLAEPVTDKSDANTGANLNESAKGNSTAAKSNKHNSKKGPAKGPKKGPAKK